MPKRVNAPKTPSKGDSSWRFSKKHGGNVTDHGQSGMEPDTGKRGVQPLGSVKPRPPRPVPPIVHVEKDK